MTGSGTDGAGFDKARKRRNLFLALALAAFVVLVFLVTIAKMKANGAL